MEIHEARERALRRQKQQEMLLKRQKPRASVSSSCSSRDGTITSSSSTLSRSTSYSSVTSTNAEQTPHAMVSLTPVPISNKNDDDAFDHVLRELRAGLKPGEHSWRISTPSPLVLRYRQRKEEEKNQQHVSIVQ